MEVSNHHVVQAKFAKFKLSFRLPIQQNANWIAILIWLVEYVFCFIILSTPIQCQSPWASFCEFYVIVPRVIESFQVFVFISYPPPIRHLRVSMESHPNGEVVGLKLPKDASLIDMLSTLASIITICFQSSLCSRLNPQWPSWKFKCWHKEHASTHS